MKAFAQILSLLILLCSIAPCADGAIASGNDTERSSIETTACGDTGHHHSEDLCSPFCSCHCCHKHSLFSEAIPLDEGAMTPFFRETLASLPEEPLLEEPDPPRA